MMAQDQQHTAAWLAAANLPPRRAQEEKDHRTEKGKREEICKERKEDPCKKGQRRTHMQKRSRNPADAATPDSEIEIDPKQNIRSIIFLRVADANED